MIIKKIKRRDLTLSFFIMALITILVFIVLKGGNIFNTLNKTLFYSPILFFTFIMITEPLTTPPSNFLRILYGTFVGFLFAPAVHIGSFYFTPELALLFGNIFSYLVSPKERLTLKLKQIRQITPNTAEFIFIPDFQLHFKPGQYFLIVHENTDSSRENLTEQFFSGCIHNNRMNVFFQQLAKLRQVFDSFQVSRFYVFSVDEDCNVNIAIGDSPSSGLGTEKIDSCNLGLVCEVICYFFFH